DGSESSTTETNDGTSEEAKTLHASGSGPSSAISFDSYVRDDTNSSWTKQSFNPDRGSGPSERQAGSSLHEEGTGSTAVRTWRTWSIDPTGSSTDSTSMATVAIEVEAPPGPLEAAAALAQKSSNQAVLSNVVQQTQQLLGSRIDKIDA